MKTRLLITILLILSLPINGHCWTINYQYDELDRLHQVTLEDSQVITYGYDKIGNLISKTISADTMPITTAAPSGGAFAATQTVTLSANKPAIIYYTTDGSTPTTSSAVYSSPMTISASTNLNYFAKDTDGISETPKSQAYIIETTPPTTTATPTGGTYYSPQTVTLSANEPATIYYTTDGTTPTTNSAVCSSPLTIFATTKLMYFAKDLVGHIETVKSQTYTIDTTPPITIATPVGGTYSPPLTVTLTASKPATIYYTTNSTIPTTSSTVYSGPLTISASTNLMYFGVDPGGNTGAVISQTYSTAYDPDSASIFQSKSGTYTHTFTSNATVTLNYLKGAGGGGGDGYDWEDGSPGGTSTIVNNGVTLATANGGNNGDGTNDLNNGPPGTATNSITGATNTTGGGGLGGAGGRSGGNGGNGGSVTGGTFAVLSGQTISVILSGGGAGGGAQGGTGANASASLSWH